MWRWLRPESDEAAALSLALVVGATVASGERLAMEWTVRATDRREERAKMAAASFALVLSSCFVCSFALPYLTT